MSGARLLQDFLIRNAAARPAAVALVRDQRSITYGELERWTNRLARLMIETGCRRGDRVCVLLPKSFEAIAGMLATLKIGGIYVPMDTLSPAAHLKTIINSVDCRFILAGRSTEKLLKQICTEGQIKADVGWLTEEEPEEEGIRPAFTAAELCQIAAEPVETGGSDDDIAHILFTSGSTGVPKGVTIAHRNVLQFVDWATEFFGYTPDDRISAHPPLHFDLSTSDLFCTLAAGAQLHIVPLELNVMPHRLADFIHKSQLTQWFSVPSLLNYMSKLDAVETHTFPFLRRLMWCGEAFPVPALMYWMRKLPHVSFTNLYGPTEATIASSYHRVSECPASESAIIPIGEPCGGETLHVLDSNLNSVPDHEHGDLYIGGAGLSPGYWRNPEATAAAYLEEPKTRGRGRLYRTGDIASRNSDGVVYLHGRADRQIKSRGHRIELGEIEHAIQSMPFIRECAVVATGTDGFEGKVICCALTLVRGLATDEETIKAQLSKLLPRYMIPSKWRILDSLPLNGNGKVDARKISAEFEPKKEGATAVSNRG
jgi:amino acid adenylation domain-containing protein